MQTILTTGQVAKICKVAPRTVTKWFDSGRLRGYRIPGSQDRRILREHLIRFLKEYGMPLGELETEGVVEVLCITGDVSKMQGIFPTAGFTISFFSGVFDLGIRAGALAGNSRVCVLIDFDHLGDQGQACVTSLREFGTPPKIIGFGSPVISHEGCDAFMRFPFEGPVLLATAARLMDMELPQAAN